MLKNKLYPYMEKYINEYLWGFSKEQLEVGVMNGTIILEKLNIRADKVNEKLDTKEMPLWFKAGKIGKISISCSLMNFIGEKPLDVSIEDIECVVAPSFKWIIRNLTSFIDENEVQIRDPYDWEDNNSHDIFTKKVNIFNESLQKPKEPFIQLFTDNSKISTIINKLFTKCMKFYYQKTYFINAKIKNIHIRFEDDHLINVISNLSMGITIAGVELSLSAEGIMKKNGFKCDSVSVYWDPKGGILIPSKTFTDCLDKENMIDSKYYEVIKNLNFRKFDSAPYLKYIVSNFNFMGNFGIQVVETGNLDFFAQNREKRYKLYLQLATSEVNFHSYPDLIAMGEHLLYFVRSFTIIDPVQEFKPMRKPYNPKSYLVKKNEKDASFSYKRKMLVRDWLFYIVWFKRFKKAVYGKNPNLIHTEFTRFYNIYCLQREKEANEVNDSIYLKNDKAEGSFINPVRSAQEVGDTPSQPDSNPDNITLSVVTEILVKGVNAYFHANTSEKDYLMIKLSGCEVRSAVGGGKCEVWVNMKSLSMNSSMVVSGDPWDKHRDTSLMDDTQMGGSSGMMINEETVIHGSQSQFPSNKSLPETGSLQSINPKILKKMAILTETLEQINQRSTNSNAISQDNFNKDKHTSEINKMQKNLDFLLREILPTSNYFYSQKPSSGVSKDISLSQAINEYNWKKNHSKPVLLKYPKQSASSNIEKNKEDEKVSLSIFEISNTVDRFSVEIKYTKINPPENLKDNGADIIALSLGAVRVNMLDNYINDCLTILSSYSVYKKSNKEIKEISEIFSNLKVKKQLYLMKKYMLAKFNDFKSSKDPNTNEQSLIKSQEMKNFYNFLQSDLECYDDKITSGQFEVNYLFGLLAKKAIEINLKCNDFYVVYYTNNKDQTASASASAIGHARLPKMDFKLFLSLSKLSMKIFSIEVDYNDIENCKDLVSNLWGILEEKLKANRRYIEPVIKKIKGQEKQAQVTSNNQVPSMIPIEQIFPSQQILMSSKNKNFLQDSDEQIALNKAPKSSYGLVNQMFPSNVPKFGGELLDTLKDNEDSGISLHENSSMNVSVEGKDCESNALDFNNNNNNNLYSKKESGKTNPSKKEKKKP